MSAYQEQYQWAKEQPEAFWRKQAQQIDWFQPPQTIWPMTNMVSNVGFPMVCSIRVG